MDVHRQLACRERKAGYIQVVKQGSAQGRLQVTQSINVHACTSSAIDSEAIGLCFVVIIVITLLIHVMFSRIAVPS